MPSTNTEAGLPRNDVLDGLDPADRARLEPHLLTTEIERGRGLDDARAMSFVYFPHDAVFSLMSVMEDGRSAETTSVGREGFVDPAAVLGGAQPLGHYVAHLPGRATRIEAERLAEAAHESPTLRARLMGGVDGFLRRTLQLAACNALHPVEARVARWLLLTQDRLASRDCRVTQDAIAELLGVQRSTVSLAMRNLQTAGHVTTRRGGVAIVDRAGLLTRACECYAILRRAAALPTRPAGDA